VKTKDHFFLGNRNQENIELVESRRHETGTGEAKEACNAGVYVGYEIFSLRCMQRIICKILQNFWGKGKSKQQEKNKCQSF
jgi:hypothetical protein